MISTRIYLLTLTLLALILLTPAAPVRAQTEALDEQRYNACLAQVQENAETGFERARDWRIQGGGIPARHCAALALVNLQKFATAAQMLESIAQDMGADAAMALRVDVLAQAGQAWLMQGDVARAIAVQTAALRLRPDDVELLIDRSIGYGGSGRFWEAIDDLNRIIELQPRRVDAFVFRASAYRLVEAPELALDDVAEALRLQPGNPDALLERGLLRRLTGDDAGARQDWLQVVRMGPVAGAALDAARGHLEKLDVKVEAPLPARPPPAGAPAAAKARAARTPGASPPAARQPPKKVEE
jgi:tetratricopeptide (TPR) repeat protein